MTYSHLGEQVTRQIVSGKFTDILRNKNIFYIDLPILTQHVIVYFYENIKKYAVIIPQASDEVEELLYITNEIPIDGWEQLVKDVEEQHNGKEPTKMRTRLNVFLNHACLMVDRQESIDKQDEFDFAEPVNPDYYLEPDYIDKVILALIHLRYDLKDLKTADHYDVNPRLLEALAERIGERNY